MPEDFSRHFRYGILDYQEIHSFPSSGRNPSKRGNRPVFISSISPEEWDKYIFRAIRPSGRNFPRVQCLYKGLFMDEARDMPSAVPDEDALLMLRVRDGDALRHGNADPQTPAFRVRHGGPHAEQRSGSGRHCPAGIHPHGAEQEYEPSARFTTWMFTILRNLVFNEVRRQKRRPHHICGCH